MEPAPETITACAEAFAWSATAVITTMASGKRNGPPSVTPVHRRHGLYLCIRLHRYMSQDFDCEYGVNSDLLPDFGWFSRSMIFSD